MNSSVEHVSPQTHSAPAAPPTLEALRARIDDIDDEIFRQLEARASLMRDVAAAKRAAGIRQLRDVRREEHLVARMVDRVDRFPRRAMAAIFREVVAACLSLQMPE